MLVFATGGRFAPSPVPAFVKPYCSNWPIFEGAHHQPAVVALDLWATARRIDESSPWTLRDVPKVASASTLTGAIERMLPG